MPILRKQGLSGLPDNETKAMRRPGYLKTKWMKNAQLIELCVGATQRNLRIGQIKRIESERAIGKRGWCLQSHLELNTKIPGKVVLKNRLQTVPFHRVFTDRPRHHHYASRSFMEICPRKVTVSAKKCFPS